MFNCSSKSHDKKYTGIPQMTNYLVHLTYYAKELSEWKSATAFFI